MRHRTTPTTVYFESDPFIFATADESLYDVRYHVPKNQCYEGSRGGTRGHVHLHVREQFDLGRIHRAPGRALCGRDGWYERALNDLEIQTACPRCAEIERRRRNA